MNWKEPENSDKYEWTEHSKYKMRQYGFSPQRVLRVIKSPKRIEEGIVEKTVAVMQPSSMKTDKEGKRTWGQEIWAMYQIKGGKQKPRAESKVQDKRVEKLKKQLGLGKKIRIISAWRYPGVSDESSPIPEDILREIEDII